MPRPNLPPTPGSLSDLKGQDGTQKLASLHLSFELPPPALHDAARISPPTDQKQNPSPTSPHSAYPMQAAETVKARRRSSAAAAKESTFALPPPPTRSRKIIQMKPPQDEGADGAPAASASAASKGKETGKGKGSAAANKNATAGANSGSGSGGQQGKGKKQPSATSAAGRKIARKTAHSLIERRRRSKMNEEFALLKSMIPACTGEMHKLAILQASIEYVRYLEDCVSKLKAQHDQDQSRGGASQLPSIREFHPTFRDDTADVDMTDSEAVSPTFTAVPDQPSNPHTRHPSASPALYAQDARGRQQSYSSVSTDHQRHYSYSASAGTSPAFGPQTQGPYATSNAGSTLTSPALNPQSDLDQEATAALLMLNNDRRGYAAAGSSRRTVSVRDLLSA